MAFQVLKNERLHDDGLVEMRYTLTMRKELFEKIKMLMKLIKVNVNGEEYFMEKHLRDLPQYCRKILNDIGYVVAAEYRLRSIQFLGALSYTYRKKKYSRYKCTIIKRLYECLKYESKTSPADVLSVMLHPKSSIYCLPTDVMKRLATFLY